MTDELQYYDEELQDIIKELQEGLDKVEEKKRMAASEKAERVRHLRERLQRSRQVLQSYKVEMRDAREHAASYDVKYRAYHDQLNSFDSRLTNLKNAVEREQVGVRTVDEMSTQEVLEEAGKVQDQSLAALGRMKETVAATKAVGVATSAKLEDQTAQLKSIDADIMKVKSNLQRADLLIRAFVRKMATDKIIMLFMCLIIIGIVVIIVYKFVDPQGAADAGVTIPDEVVDPLGRRS